MLVVQSSQNADTRAIQDKLDEIIKSLPKADDSKKNEETRLKKKATKNNLANRGARSYSLICPS